MKKLGMFWLSQRREDAKSVERTFGSDIDNEYLYTGRRLDPETGLQLNRNRFYASHLGRWVNRDPIGYWGGLNLYGYVTGRPTYYVDPTGLDKWRPGRPPQDKPPGTIPIDQHPDIDDVEDVKPQMKPEGVGPPTWVGIDPEGNVIVPDADGNAENLGPWQDFLKCNRSPEQQWADQLNQGMIDGMEWWDQNRPQPQQQPGWSFPQIDPELVVAGIAGGAAWYLTHVAPFTPFLDPI